MARRIRYRHSGAKGKIVSEHPVGWIPTPTQSSSGSASDPSSNTRQDQLSTAVGWLFEPNNPQKPSAYPQGASDGVGGDQDSSHTVLDDVSRETLTQDDDDE